jgi:rubrerythrin
MGEQNLVEVYRARNTPAAYLLKAALEDAGIKVVIEGELLQGVMGEVPLGWSSTPRVLVESQEESRAREIIRHTEKAALAARTDSNERDETNVCLSCGAHLREEEETCPACGWSYKNGFSSE